jgi:uncharacterized membrane protein YdjX (TVP38/TMEM64 family)
VTDADVRVDARAAPGNANGGGIGHGVRDGDGLAQTRSGRWRQRLLGMALLLGLTALSFGAFRVAHVFPESPLFLLGLAAGAGAATGELTGYIAGRSGRLALGNQDHHWFGRIHRLIDGHGFMTLFLLSAIPNPRFDIAGITAGSLGFSPVRYWLAVALGKTLVYTLLARGGQALLPFLH